MTDKSRDAGSKPARREKGAISPRPYRAPRLVVYGDVRDITLGGSIGAGESGNPNRFPG